MTSSPPPDDPDSDPRDGVASPRSTPTGPGSESNAPRLPFPVAGVGASAGGLEALEALTQRLSPDGMAFVVVQHLAPGHVSMLPEILKRGTSMRVVTIEAGMRLEVGVIYVAPPNVTVSIDGDRLQIVPP